MTAEQLDSLIESSAQTAGMKYIFIDEIQNVMGFEEVINGFRTESDYSIFITGSNSYLLSGELVTKLTGRYLEFEMFPLTYIINNFGATTNINGLNEALVKNGMVISRATVTRYIRILIDAKILYECKRFDMKSKKHLSYVQVAYKMLQSKDTEDREYRPLESIREIRYNNGLHAAKT